MEQARFPIAGVTYHAPDTVAVHRASGAWIWSSIGDALREAARVAPEREFIVADDGALSFADLDAKSESLAASLLDAGLRPGDRAIFQVGAVKELVLALFGCFKAGIIPVCTLPQYREIEIGQLTKLSGARAYFVQSDFSPSFDLAAFARRMIAQHQSLDTLVILRGPHAIGELSLTEMAAQYSIKSARAKTLSVDPSPADVASFQLSGGSTGVPKIIPRMHAEYLGSAASWDTRLDLGENDVSLWALPLIHNAGMLIMIMPALLKRRTLVIQSRFDVDDFLAAIEKYRVTFTGSIGPIATRIIDHPNIGQFDLSSLRSLFTLSRAGGVEDKISACALQMYGITEGLVMASRPTAAASARHETMGWPTGIGDEIKLLDLETQGEIKHGATGELCFRSPYMLCGYFNAPELTRESFTKDGFFRTGDMVRSVEIGGRMHFIFEGRLKDNINRGGEKFGAEEVEFLVAKHPAVRDVRIVAMPDTLLGERPCAYIIAKSGHELPSVAELGEFLQRQGLAKFKLPERIEAIDEFPTTRVGKVDKRALRDMITERVRSEMYRDSIKVG